MSKRALFSLIFLFAAPSAWAGAADYTVPTTDDSLKPYAQFQFKVSCAKTGDTLTIQYPFPIELTGVPTVIELRQSVFDNNLYYGTNGEMKCDDKGCNVKYHDLPFDKAKLSDVLHQESKSVDEEKGRMALALIHVGDPGGTFDETPAQYCATYP